jgi:hypothetical protein
VIAGSATGRITKGGNLGGYGTIRNLVLFRIAPGNTLDAMVEINSNELSVTDGWGIAADCQRADLPLTVVRSSGGWDAACFFVGHTSWDPATSALPAWRQAQVVATQHGLALPDNTVTAGFRVANRRDVLDVRFHFRDRRTPALASDVAAWSAMLIGCLEMGLKNRLPASLRLPAPGATDAALDHASMAHRRQERLASLHASGALSADEFTRQSAALRQAEVAGNQAGADPTREEFYRLLSLQGLTVTSDAVVTFLWTAQSVQAAALTMAQAGLRIGRGYVTAYVWDWYGGAPTRPDTPSTLDFAYAGVVR